MKAILKAFDLGQRYGSRPNFRAVTNREGSEEGGVEWGARKGGREGGREGEDRVLTLCCYFIKCSLDSTFLVSS